MYMMVKIAMETQIATVKPMIYVRKAWNTIQLSLKCVIYDIQNQDSIYILQAIRVLRTGDFAPFVVFVAAPTIAAIHEVKLYHNVWMSVV